MAGATNGSRTTAVLSSDYVAGLDALGMEELRDRRDQALAEREYQSYLRRLIQVRQDLLQNERSRRAAGGAPGGVVDRLKAVLAEGPQGRGRGEAPRFALPDADVAEAERRADGALPQGSLANLETLTDDQLDGGLATLGQAERAVSADRAAVIRVHDRLQEELKRRYRDDPSQVLRGGE